MEDDGGVVRRANRKHVLEAPEYIPPQQQEQVRVTFAGIIFGEFCEKRRSMQNDEQAPTKKRRRGGKKRGAAAQRQAQMGVGALLQTAVMQTEEGELDDYGNEDVDGEALLLFYVMLAREYTNALLRKCRGA